MWPTVKQSEKGAQAEQEELSEDYQIIYKIRKLENLGETDKQL